MKIRLKKGSVEAEADVERIIEKGMDNHEKDWKEKFDSKHNAKKEILELKHKHKMELEEAKAPKIEDIKEKNELKSRKTIKIAGIVLFFIYGLFCIVGFRDSHIAAAIISLVQIVLVTISVLSSAELFSIFKNDYKICLIISILLILPWMALAV